MPSPFPGMAPYLESAQWWHNLHTRMMSGIYDALNTSLPPNYIAMLEERLYISEGTQKNFPDVSVLERHGEVSNNRGSEARAYRAMPSSAAVLDPPLLIQLEEEREREVYVEVRRQTAGDSEVVTSIELLSPANKRAGAGREEYVKKQRQVIESQIHLLEIDLISAGRSPLLPTREQLSRQMPYDYAISLHRAGAGNTLEVWLRTVRQPLPRTVFIPLAAGDDDVLLNLQEIFDRCYDIGRYTANVDYAIPPLPHLSAEDSAWADVLLREKGFR